MELHKAMPFAPSAASKEVKPWKMTARSGCSAFWNS